MLHLHLATVTPLHDCVPQRQKFPKVHVVRHSSATNCHWQCMQASALRAGLRMVRVTIPSLLKMLAYLLGLAGGLAARAGQVFVGTYRSPTWEVRRAGAVADLNAAVFAAAVILLATSRHAFTDAQVSTSCQAWLTQLAEYPKDACNTFNREPYHGVLFHGITFHCDVPRGPGKTSSHKDGVLERNVSGIMQVLKALELYNNCGAFAMAYRVQRYPVQLILHTGQAGVASALKLVADDIPKQPQNDTMYYLDVIKPLDSCDAHPHSGAGKSSEPGTDVQCAVPCAGSAAPAQILRYLTSSSDGGLFVYFNCNQSGVDACFNQKAEWRSIDFPDPVGQADAFCPVPGNASIMWSSDHSEHYHCADGFDVSQNLNLQKDKVDGLKLVYKFVYFHPCLSYDELFGVYIAIVGVFVTACLGTMVLLVTDIVCPMLKWGSQAWTPLPPAVPGMHASATLGCPERLAEDRVHASGMAGAAEQGFQVGQGSLCCKDVVDILLRCTVSAILGTLVGVVCVLLPWWLALRYKNWSHVCI